MAFMLENRPFRGCGGPRLTLKCQLGPSPLLRTAFSDELKDHLKEAIQGGSGRGCPVTLYWRIGGAQRRGELFRVTQDTGEDWEATCLVDHCLSCC